MFFQFLDLQKNDMKKLQLNLFLIMATLFLSNKIVSQNYTIDSLIRFTNGVGFYPADKSFSMNLHFRIQNKIGLATKSEDDLGISETEAMVKRMRLKIDGFVLNPKLTYLFHLGFTRYDMDWDKTSYPGIIRDALINYKPNNHWQFSFGQTKIQGSKQKMVSSGQQQFIDRSIASNTYGSDRDFGLFANYLFKINKAEFTFKTSVTTGDGRNAGNTNNGYEYTGRLEILPLGAFTANGQFYEGDIKRESKPKLSLGAAYTYDSKAMKSAGHYGTSLFEARNVYGYYADMLFKYKGIGIIAEYLSRKSDANPFTTSGENTSYVNIGQGAHFQGSYCFKNKWEIAGRYTFVTTDEKINSFEKNITYYTLGVTKYLKEHRIKLQSNLSYKTAWYTSGARSSNYILQFQMELGI
jgi:phosphate-selective porin OprO and OprP